VPPQSFARLFLRTYPSQTSLCCLNVIGWFRSTSPGLTRPVCSHYTTITWFDMCPFIFRLFLRTYPSHISVTAFTVSHIIGLFRSTVLRVMSPTRFLCATMMGCRWMVSIHLLRHFYWLARIHYASMTFTSSGGFDPPPPTVVGTHPLRFNDSFDMCPPSSFARLFLCTYPSQPSLCHISLGCFDQPSFGL
jgi:hypothetical protein